MRKRVYTIARDPELEQMIADVKDWSREKTDSKTIVFLLKWGYGRLGLKQ